MVKTRTPAAKARREAKIGACVVTAGELDWSVGSPSGATYKVARRLHRYKGKPGVVRWHCSCRAPGRCVHIEAVVRMLA